MVVLYSNNAATVQLWEKNCSEEKTFVHRCEESLMTCLKSLHVNTVVVIDERLYKLNEIEDFLGLLQESYTLSFPVVLSPVPTFARGFLLLQYGIKAYGNTFMAPIHFQEMLACVQKGDIWLYPEFIQTMISTLSSQKIPLKHDPLLLTLLSPKEQEVARFIKEGLSNKEIATHLNVTERTVKAHLSSIYEKTGAKDRLGLAISL